MRSRGVLVNRKEVDAPLRQLCLPHQPKRAGRGINLLATTSNSDVTGKHITYKHMHILTIRLSCPSLEETKNLHLRVFFQFEVVNTFLTSCNATFVFHQNILVHSVSHYL